MPVWLSDPYLGIPKGIHSQAGPILYFFGTDVVSNLQDLISYQTAVAHLAAALCLLEKLNARSSAAYVDMALHCLPSAIQRTDLAPLPMQYADLDFSALEKLLDELPYLK